MVFSFGIMAISRYIYGQKFVNVCLSKISCLYVALLVTSAVLIIIFDSLYIHIYIVLAAFFILLTAEKKSVGAIIEKIKHRYINKGDKQMQHVQTTYI